MEDQISVFIHHFFKGYLADALALWRGPADRRLPIVADGFVQPAHDPAPGDAVGGGGVGLLAAGFPRGRPWGEERFSRKASRPGPHGLRRGCRPRGTAARSAGVELRRLWAASGAATADGRGARPAAARASLPRFPGGDAD